MSFKNIFSRLFTQESHAKNSETPSVALITAVLYVEMMRMDYALKTEEINETTYLLQTTFDLSTEDIKELIDLAHDTAEAATDYFAFTSQLNDVLSLSEKTTIIENLWRIAHADKHLEAHEEHFVRKIADLLYVPHSEFIAAKHRAIESGE